MERKRCQKGESSRRRAKVDRSSEEPDSDRQDGGEGRRQEVEKSSSPGKPFSQPGSQAGSESPKPGRRQLSAQEPGQATQSCFVNLARR